MNAILDCGKGWLALDKPSGMASHATDKNEEDALTYVERLLKADSALAKRTEWDGFVSCAHRLDRETSGVLLITLRRNLASLFQSAFEEKSNGGEKVAKTYRAVLRGRLEKERGLWSFPISDRSEGRQNPQGAAGDRKAAETRFEVKRRNDYLTEIAVDLLTGRQHQIRKHAAIAKHQVVGDLRYGDKKHAETIRKRYGVSRLLLHAENLEMNLPDFKLNLTAPIPPEFDAVFSKSKSP